MSYRGRFAPSPTGSLHLGSLLVAVASWLRARQQGGVWIVRMEDVDPAREIPGSAAEIRETLSAFGLVSDEPVWKQSQRAEFYAAALKRMQQSGDAFPCWCSRSELQPSHGLHQGKCRGTAQADRPPAWRLLVPDREIVFDDLLQGRQRQRLRDEVGDFVLWRVEGHAAYQLAVVIDDAAQDISEVVRGADLLDSTARQIYLQQLLGYATPRYLHLPLLLDSDGKKLSKQTAALPVDACDPIPPLRTVLNLLGIGPERLPRAASVAHLLHSAVAAFNLQQIAQGTALAAPMLHSPNASE